MSRDVVSRASSVSAASSYSTENAPMASAGQALALSQHHTETQVNVAVQYRGGVRAFLRLYCAAGCPIAARKRTVKPVSQILPPFAIKGTEPSATRKSSAHAFLLITVHHITVKHTTVPSIHGLIMKCFRRGFTTHANNKVVARIMPFSASNA